MIKRTKEKRKAPATASETGARVVDSNMVSAVWQYCTRLPNNGVKCNVCARVMAFHGTTNLRVHIGRHFGIKPSKQRMLAAEKPVPHKSNSSPAQIKIGSPIVLTTQDPLATPKVSPTKIVTPSSTVRVSTPTPVVVPSRPVSTASSDSTSSGPEVYLRWDSYNNNMRNMFPTLLSSERFVDVTLACEGQSVKCHKFMLSACSPYFDKLLGENPCRHPIVLLKDLQFWEVQAILDFIYKGEVKVSQEKLPSLLAAAECLQIKGLSESSLSTPWWNESSNENSSSKPKHSEREKKTKKRKSHQQYISELKESGSVDDSNSETSEDETSRLIVVGNKVDEADSTSSSIPTTNGIVLKKIKLESSRPSVKEESESIKKENHVGSKNPGSSVKKKSSMSGPPNLIKIEHSQYPISTKTELDDASYDEDWKDDGSSSPNYYPAYPEAIVDTVLTEEDSSNQ